jgi:hypothetical protein
MKVLVGFLLVVFGILLLAGNALSFAKNVDATESVVALAIGFILLIAGLKLQETKKPKPESPAASAESQTAAPGLDGPTRSDPTAITRVESFKSSANFGVACGIILMFAGSAITQKFTAQEMAGGLLVGSLVAVGGWAWLIWGCVNYMRWKGYSGWFGFFGYLLLVGLIIVACFPNRRRSAGQKQGPEARAELEALAKEDQRSGRRFVLALVPLGLVVAGVGCYLFYIGSNISAGEWEALAPPGLGFQALMPGTPQRAQQAQDIFGSKLEMSKYTVEPRGKKELFMIVVLGFPGDLGRDLGGAQKLLELGRQDLLFFSQGQLRSERPITLGSFPGVELEVLPPKGAIIKARIFATPKRLYQVMVHVPKIRLDSEDVQKFFNAFTLLAEPGAAPEPGSK